MTRSPFAVLFLCSGNSARSIMAEAILNQAGNGRFKAYSAGPRPVGSINRHAETLLRNLGLPIEGLHSKNWEEFAAADAPAFDFVVTLCDSIAGEACPSGLAARPRTHWSIPDPAAATGSDAELTVVFAETYRMLKNRIEILVSLPMEKLDGLAVTRQLEAIGAS